MSFLLNCSICNAAWPPRYFTGCEPDLTRPTPTKFTSPGAVRVDSGPVRLQCLGTCQFEAVSSLVQAHTSVGINSDYLNLARLTTKAKFILAQIDAGNFTGAARRVGLPDVLDALTSDLRQALGSIRSNHALVRQADFAFPGDLRSDLQSYWDQAATGPYWYVSTRPPAEQLATRVAILIDRLLARDPDAERLRAEVLSLLARAQRGLKPGADPRRTTASLLKGFEMNPPQTLRTQPTDEVGDELLELGLKTIKDRLDRNDNVALTFWINPAMKREDGIMLLDRSVVDERAWIRAHPRALGYHAVVIDGYELDVTGRVAWLWIKDSWGDGRFDFGYVHMHVNVFRAYAGTLFTVK